MHPRYRRTCRVCGSAALTPAVDLGLQHIQGVFAKPGEEPPPYRKLPLSLVRCDPTQDEHACGLLQMERTVPPEILYSAYWYRSGTNDTMRNHLRAIAEEATALVGKPATRVLDKSSVLFPPPSANAKCLGAENFYSFPSRRSGRQPRLPPL